MIFLEHKKAYRAHPPGGPGRGLHDPDRRGRDQARGQRHHPHHLWHDDAPLHEGRRDATEEDRRRASRSSTCAPYRRGTRTRVLESVEKTGKALIVYEDNITGGFGAEVAATIAQDAFDFLDGPVTRVASPDVPISPYSSILEEYILPNPEKIAEAIRKLAAY